LEIEVVTIVRNNKKSENLVARYILVARKGGSPFSVALP
jgi:hypothetical protein